MNDAMPTRTLKEAHGGSNKWALRHLPAGTADRFSSEVVPLVCKKAGALDPWDNLTIQQVQDIIDKVYGVESYKVVEEGVWFGLVSVFDHIQISCLISLRSSCAFKTSTMALLKRPSIQLICSSRTIRNT